MTPGAASRAPIAGRPKAWVSWSSGKDSALALHQTSLEGTLEVTGLLTTVDAGDERVAMHGVRRTLLEAQAERLGLPLCVVELPWPCPNDVYEERMATAVERARGDGVEAMVFGDLFLDDIRAYREASLEGTGITPAFPLWRRPTRGLARQLLELGVRASRHAGRQLLTRARRGPRSDGLRRGHRPMPRMGGRKSIREWARGDLNPLSWARVQIRPRDGRLRRRRPARSCRRRPGVPRVVRPCLEGRPMVGHVRVGGG